MRVKPIAILGNSDRAYLKEKYSLLLNSWAKDWLTKDIEFNIEVVTNITDEWGGGKKCLKIQHSSNESIFYAYSEDTQAYLIKEIFVGEDLKLSTKQFSSLTSEMFYDSLEDLASRLIVSGEAMQLTRFLLDTKNLNAEKNDFSKGYIGLEIQFKYSQLQMLVSTLSVKDLYQSSEEKIHFDLKQSFSNQFIKTSVMLGEIELDVNALTQLQVGDVIQLDKLLDEPLSLKIENSEHKLKGYLGKHAGNYAFKVLEKCNSMEG